MRRSIQSAHLVFIASLLVGVSAGARAAEPEPVEAAMSDTVLCVEIPDGKLDLRVLANVSDIWSYDGNTSIGNSQGEVTLYVVTSKSLVISARFDELTDKAKVVDSNGGEAWLVPATTRDPVSTVVPVVTGGSITFSALSGGTAQLAMIPPKPVGNSNKAVIKPVSTCPTQAK